MKMALLMVLVVAFAFRLATGFFLGFNAPPDRAACGADTEEFELGAWNMAQGNGFVLWEGGQSSAFRAPGYPLMLAGIYRLAGREFWLNRVMLSVIGTLTCLLVYWLVLAVRLGAQVALCAALVVALHPLQAYFCGHFMSEVPSAFLNVLATLLLVKGCRLQVAGESLAEARRSQRMKNEEPSAFSFQLSALLLAGLLNGLSVLVRPAAIFLVPVFGGLLLLTQWRRPVRAILLAVLFGLGTLLAVAPWTIRNYKVFDRFCLVSSGGGAVLWGANNEFTAEIGGKHWGSWVTSNFFMDIKKKEVLSLSNEIDRDRREWEQGVAFLKGNPRKIPGLLAGKLYRLMTPFPQSANRVFVLIAALSQVVMLVLCGIGLIGFRLTTSDLPTSDFRHPTSALHLPLLGQLLTLLATVLIFYGSERFRVPYEPILAVYAGLGLWVSLAWMKARVGR